MKFLKNEIIFHKSIHIVLNKSLSNWVERASFDYFMLNYFYLLRI